MSLSLSDGRSCKYFLNVTRTTGSLSITISFAQSIDGRIATVSGDSRWISGKETLELAHRLREENDAVLVGIGTVISDDPELTCRLPGAHRNPLRVVLDASLRIPVESKLVRTASRINTVVFSGPEPDTEKLEILESSGVRVVKTAVDASGRIVIPGVMDRLRADGCRSLCVEGGSKVITSFLASGLVQRMLVVTAPLIIGDGISAIGNLGVRTLAEALRPSFSTFHPMGNDIVWELQFETSGQFSGIPGTSE